MASGNHTGRYTSALTPAAARVLDVASGLFYERGVRAVGVDTIAAAAGVTKKTIYDQFRSKDALIATYLERRDRRYRTWLAEHVAGHPDVDPLVAVFDALEAWMAEIGPRGCAFVNAYAEFSEPDHPARRIAREQKAWLRDFLAQLATEAGHTAPEELAAELATLHEGATVLHSAGADPDAAATARRAAGLLVTAAGR